MVTGCGTAYAVVHENVWTHGLPATIVYDYPEFVLVLDAERDDDETDADEYKIVCLHCLIDEHSELGRAIDVAKERGSAHLINKQCQSIPLING